MSILEFDDDNARTLDEMAATKGVIFGTPPDVNFFSGALGAPLKGLMRGVVAKPAKLMGDAVTPLLRPAARAVDDAFGTHAVSGYLDGELKKNNEMLKDLKADPVTTGTAGQLLHGLFDIGSSAILYTPEGAAMMEGYATQQDFIDKGVNPGTATAAGVVTGAAFFAGVKVPMTMGAAAAGQGLKGLAANAAMGASVNVAAGVANRGMTHDLLESAGHTDMAAQYLAYDKQALLTEAVLGAVLSGGVGAIEARSAAKQHALDSALVVNNALHATRDTAPGAPVDAGSAAAHQSSLEAAIDQLMRGERVDIADKIVDAEFLRPAPARAAEAAIPAAIREAYRAELPAAARHAPSERLLEIPVDQRRKLPFNAAELNEYAASIEQKYDLPGGLLNALKNAGEKSGSGAVSPKGARGVMQFMPANLKKYGVTDAADPGQVIDAAGRYLRDTSTQYGGNVDAMVADYNGGPRQARRVMNGEAPAAAETQAYMARVRDYLGRDKPVTKRAAEPRPEEFANSVQRVAELDPVHGTPTFRDGTAYTRESILPFYDQAVVTREAGAAVPDVLFRVGRIDDQVAAGLEQYLPKFDGNAREAQISSDAIRAMAEQQPATARDVLAKIDDGALYADEVLPNPAHPSRAILVLRGDTKGGRATTMLDVAMTERGIEVVAPAVSWAKSLDSALALKREMDASRPPPQIAAAAETTMARPNPPPGAVIPVSEGAPTASERSPGPSNSSAERLDTQSRTNAAAALDSFGAASRPRTEAASSSEGAELRSARAIASELGDMRVTMDDGTEMTAREALAQTDDAIVQAKDDSRAFEAAITCFLRNRS